jgi:hypothetical protein
MRRKWGNGCTIGRPLDPSISTASILSEPVDGPVDNMTLQLEPHAAAERCELQEVCGPNRLVDAVATRTICTTSLRRPASASSARQRRQIFQELCRGE